MAKRLSEAAVRGCSACSPHRPARPYGQGALVLATARGELAGRVRQALGLHQPVAGGPMVGPAGADLAVQLDWLADHLNVGEQQALQATVADLPGEAPVDLLPLAGSLVPLRRLLAGRQEERLIRLLDPASLVSFLQPIVRLSDRSIYGYEALLRSRQDYGLVLPGELWHVARAAGRSARLECLGRAAAIEAKANFLQPGEKLFINVAPSAMLASPGCVDHSLTLAKTAGVPLEDLVFELIETERVLDTALLRTRLEGYRRRGIGVALDDFGSGYAPLKLLATLPVDYVKIDRALIDGMHRDPTKARIVTSIVDLCGQLGVRTIAEGIETVEDYRHAVQLGFDLAQGFYLGMPHAEPASLVVGAE